MWGALLGLERDIYLVLRSFCYLFALVIKQSSTHMLFMLPKVFLQDHELQVHVLLLCSGIVFCGVHFAVELNYV